jgi:hypothetical protein
MPKVVLGQASAELVFTSAGGYGGEGPSMSSVLTVQYAEDGNKSRN